jgi:hypothetical protein
MACTSVCRLCNRLILSQAITFADGTLTVNLPDGSYANGEKYCIVLAQSIPSTATITAPVVFTIGTGTTQFHLTNRCCAAVTASAIRTRTKYSTIVVTSANGATFRMIGRPCCSPSNNLTAVNAETGATTA